MALFERGDVKYDVVYYDNWLGVENFTTLVANSEEEAKEVFENDFVDEGDEDRYEINTIRYAYTDITLLD